jgi:hypothetical protein
MVLINRERLFASKIPNETRIPTAVETPIEIPEAPVLAVEPPKQAEPMVDKREAVDKSATEPAPTKLGQGGVWIQGLLITQDPDGTIRIVHEANKPGDASSESSIAFTISSPTSARLVFAVAPIHDASTKTPEPTTDEPMKPVEEEKQEPTVDEGGVNEPAV